MSVPPTPSPRSIAALLLLTGCSATSALAAGPEFIPIPSPFAGPATNPAGCFLTGFRSGFYGIRVSGDGQTVAGIAYPAVQSQTALQVAHFRWTRSTGSQAITPVLGITYEGITGLTTDGSTIFGSNWSWTQASGYRSLSDLLPPGPLGFGYFFGASADGQTLAGVGGSFLNFNRLDAFRLPLATGQREILPTTTEYPSAFFFNSISGDGRIVAGAIADRDIDPADLADEPRYAAVVWTPGDTIIVAPSSTESYVNDLSFDGTVAVGSMKMGSFNAVPFRWTAATGAQILPGTDTVLQGNDSGEARAVSADGSVLVGNRTVFGQQDTRAILFTAELGWLDLEAALTEYFGLGDAIEGWQLISLWDVSDDGRTIVGTGLNPDGCTQAFLVVLGAPCPADLTGDGFVDDTDFVLFAAAYEQFSVPPASADADFNADGFVDDPDFVIFAQAYATFACP